MLAAGFDFLGEASPAVGENRPFLRGVHQKTEGNRAVDSLIELLLQLAGMPRTGDHTEFESGSLAGMGNPVMVQIHQFRLCPGQEFPQGAGDAGAEMGLGHDEFLLRKESGCSMPGFGAE